MNVRAALLLLFFICLSLSGWAQMMQAPGWSITASPAKVPLGGETELIIKAQIPKDWYLYSNDFDPDLGPMLTEFAFQPHASYALVGKATPVGAKRKYDELWEGEYTYFTGTAEFRQKIKVLHPNPKIRAAVSYQICSDVSGQCIPFDTDLVQPKLEVLPATGKKTTIPVETIVPPTESPKEVQEKGSGKGSAVVLPTEQPKGAAEQLTQEATTDTAGAPVAQAVEEPLQFQQEPLAAEELPVLRYKPFENPFGAESSAEADGGLLGFFLLAFGAGLAALLTPCVFPMIPMTVTYFTRSGGNRRRGIIQALVYGVSIVVIYTLVGTVFALLFGAEFANWLSTHWVPNLFFFFVFLLFALSFFGLFEITLPSSLVNQVDQQADKGGWIGIFFMAFTLVLVGFSCTGPIVGTILIEAADGQALKPVLGMLGFSLAFALPFTLFAIFPGWLSSLPKSGGWLNSVKVVLGFVELALALKFLSVADQVYHWGLLDREVYLALWIIIFTLLGFYLLGKLRMPHDSPQSHTSVAGLVMAILTFGFVLYLIPGLFGAPLKSLAGYLPPMSTHDFNLVAMLKNEEERELPALCEQPKYDELLHLPHGLDGYFTYEQARACARAQNKPLFIDFTGHGCVNCREMEANVWSDPAVLKRLQEDYVVVALYVDEKQELPQNQWYISAYDGKLKSSIGKQNLDFMIQRLNANAQPYYTLVDPMSETLLTAPKAYDLEVSNFVEFLDAGLQRYRQTPLAQK